MRSRTETAPMMASGTGRHKNCRDKYCLIAVSRIMACKRTSPTIQHHTMVSRQGEGNITGTHPSKGLAGHELTLTGMNLASDHRRRLHPRAPDANSDANADER